MKPVSAIGKVKGGKRLPPGSKYVPRGIPYVRSTDIRDLRVDLSEVVHISPEQQERIARYPLEYGDVVITIAGTIGAVGMLDERLDQCHFNENLARITQIDGLNPMYLAVYLDTRFGQAHIKYLTGGAVQPKLSLESINKIQIPLPPRTIQDRIAQVMQDAHTTRQEKLTEAESLLGGIDEYALGQLGIDASLIRHEKRFTASVTEFSGHKWRVENHDVRGLDEALQGAFCKSIRISELAITVNDRVRPEGNFRYIEIGHIDTSAGLIKIEELLLCDGSTAPNNAQRQVRKGDILISTRRPTRGAIATVPDELDGEICTVFFSIVRLKKDAEVLSDYLSAFLRTSVGRLQIQQAITETTYPVISDYDVERLFVPMPSLEIQHQIATEISERRSKAKSLYAEAETVIAEASVHVERMILGQEKVQ